MTVGGTSSITTRAGNADGVSAAAAGQLEQRGELADERVQLEGRAERPRGQERGLGGRVGESGSQEAWASARQRRGEESTAEQLSAITAITARRPHSEDPRASDSHSCSMQPPRGSLSADPCRLVSSGGATLVVKPASTRARGQRK
ncbi:hypothetical protein H1C71_025260 [Ictidomys tridecemlineatus]|nr:hypothetical protein H1C71_025260 [Ictidomys tridecemlineatus]